MFNRWSRLRSSRQRGQRGAQLRVPAVRRGFAAAGGSATAGARAMPQGYRSKARGAFRYMPSWCDPHLHLRPGQTYLVDLTLLSITKENSYVHYGALQRLAILCELLHLLRSTCQASMASGGMPLRCARSGRPVVGSAKHRAAQHSMGAQTAADRPQFPTSCAQS